MNNINAALLFIVGTLFELYLYVLILRFVLPLIRADYHNPLSQLAIKLTEPLLSPLQRSFPSINYVNTGILFLLLIVALVKLLIIFLLQYHVMPNLLGSIIWAIGDILSLATNLLFFGIIVVVILSWVGPGVVNPMIDILHRLVEPYLGFFRKYIPPIAGLDLSPIVALMVIQLIKILIIAPIKGLGLGLM